MIHPDRSLTTHRDQDGPRSPLPVVGFEHKSCMLLCIRHRICCRQIATDRTHLFMGAISVSPCLGTNPRIDLH